MFKSWCIKNNIYTNNASKATHLLLNGGKLCVPNYLHNEFIKEYHKSLHQNEILYVVEKISQTIKLFIDIDAKDVKDFDIHTLILQIKHIIPEQIIELKCNSTNGYHLIFPTIEITPIEADKFVKALRQKIITKYNYDEILITNIIDTSVYKTGLRMIGSHKMNLERYYTIDKKQKKHITIEDIETSMIRTSDINPDSQIHSLDITTSTNISHKNIIKELERLHENYKNIRITKIKKIDNSTYCIGTNSHYCMNKNSDHTNHIYFVVNQKNIYQKCFCSNNKTENRKHGMCNTYKSKSFPFSWNVYNELKLLS